MQDEIAALKSENNQLRLLCHKQQDEIETLNEYADAVECLRDIGKVIGCDHVDCRDGRRKLVNCVEQEFDRLSGRLREFMEEKLVAGIAKKPEILDKLRERLESNEIVD